MIDELRKMVDQIQTAISSAVGAMQVGTEHFESGTELADHAREAFEEIVQSIEETNTLAQSITGGTARKTSSSGFSFRRAVQNSGHGDCRH